MTLEQLHAWRAHLDRIARRGGCEAEDVPRLVRRLGIALAELEPRLAAEPRQLELVD